MLITESVHFRRRDVCSTRRRLPWLALACLLLLALPVRAQAEDLRVWLLLPENSGSYSDTAKATLAALPRNTSGQISLLDEGGNWANAIAPNDLIVPLGMHATKAALQAKPQARVLAALIPRQTAGALAEETSAGRRFSALVLDQPLERQMALIRLTLPKATKVGAIIGKHGPKAELARAAAQTGLHLQIEAVETQGELFASQRELLRDNDALLAVPDASVLNQTTLMSYLITAYRARVPVFGFSQNLVEAGALAAVYSTPEQMGHQLAELIAEMQSIKSFKPGLVIHPSRFKILINRQVARSLDIRVAPDDSIQKQLETRSGITP